ncbi:uncharacterized protein MONBRDRAFT_36954 [Monosiga brevicollis MX1]|uniref:ADP-ribosylation factor n=1 Tax=Monosiga brevicollis TaxID=81824 RepID=A9UYM5_MONBE|nr:uncharacterized protein MONBRDRAFT_36954 [Monosiga brevicollis MX1]EDQ89630.1 predicted protein [Monosiga brevicollis MX1]|eukprot:XP_001745659.1 hypothetical protein [Monosiga brevicollis MX1]
MGLVASNLFNWLKGDMHARVVMVGLDAAGKTTILYKLKLGEVITTIPTIGFNVEEVQYKGLSMNVWDVGGQSKIRPLWRHYYNNVDAVIYVVDSADAERVEEAREELHDMLKDPALRNTCLLVYANKQDAAGAQATAALAERLQLHGLGSRQWYIQPTCALKADGLYEGLDWLSRTLRTRK